MLSFNGVLFLSNAENVKKTTKLIGAGACYSWCASHSTRGQIGSPVVFECHRVAFALLSKLSGI